MAPLLYRQMDMALKDIWDTHFWAPIGAVLLSSALVIATVHLVLHYGH